MHVDHDAVGEPEVVAVEGRRERLLVAHAAGDHGVDFGVLGFDERDAANRSSGIFQKLRVLGRWQPMTELGRPAGVVVASATMAAITAPTKPTPMTTTISLPSHTGRAGEGRYAVELGGGPIPSKVRCKARGFTRSLA